MAGSSPAMTILKMAGTNPAMTALNQVLFRDDFTQP
jgi:hypothetical protein